MLVGDVGEEQRQVVQTSKKRRGRQKIMNLWSRKRLIKLRG